MCHLALHAPVALARVSVSEIVLGVGRSEGVSPRPNHRGHGEHRGDYKEVCLGRGSTKIRSVPTALISGAFRLGESRVSRRACINYLSTITSQLSTPPTKSRGGSAALPNRRLVVALF